MKVMLMTITQLLAVVLFFCLHRLHAVDTTECRTTDKGNEYTGTISETKFGIPCLAWSLVADQEGINKFVTAANFPDGSVAAASNYCRNPSYATGPWCYTTPDESSQMGIYGYAWAYCDIPTCAEVDPCSSDPCKHGGSCTKSSATEFTCECPMYWTGPTCEVVDTTECRTTDKGNEYTGTISETKFGIPCLAWSLVADQEGIKKFVTAANFPDESVAAASNYCRNPDYATGPWCYTTPDVSSQMGNNGYAWAYCDIPTCA